MIKINSIEIERSKMIKYSKYFENQSKDHFQKEDTFNFELKNIESIKYILDCINDIEKGSKYFPHLNEKDLDEVEYLREYLGLRNISERLDFSPTIPQEFDITEIIPNDIEKWNEIIEIIGEGNILHVNRSEREKRHFLVSLYEKIEQDLWIYLCNKLKEIYKIEMNYGDYVSLGKYTERNFSVLFFDGEKLLPFDCKESDDDYGMIPSSLSENIGINIPLNYWSKLCDGNYIPINIEKYKDDIINNLIVVEEIKGFDEHIITKSLIYIGLRQFTFIFILTKKNRISNFEEIKEYLSNKNVIHASSDVELFEDIATDNCQIDILNDSCELEDKWFSKYIRPLFVVIDGNKGFF